MSRFPLVTRPLSVFLAATCHLGAAEPPAAGSLLPGGPGAWTLAWSDEFEYPDSGLEEKWISQNSASTHILSSRWRENSKVADGTLKLLNKKGGFRLLAHKFQVLQMRISL